MIGIEMVVDTFWRLGLMDSGRTKEEDREGGTESKAISNFAILLVVLSKLWLAIGFWNLEIIYLYHRDHPK